MTDTEKDTERNAFAHGINIIRKRKHGFIVSQWVMLQISLALKEGGLSDKALYSRKYGIVNHGPAEREKIEKIFRDYGVPEPWGLK